MTTADYAADRRTREPSRELAGHLRTLIETGEWPPGFKLPTARELASEHDVSLTTAVRAVAIVRDEGLLTTIRGTGSYVTSRTEIPRYDASRYTDPHPDGLSPNRKEAAAENYWDEIDHWQRWTTEATPELASRLGVEPGAAVSAVLYRFCVAGVPTQIATQWEPLALTAGTSAELPSSGERGQPSGHARFVAIGWHITRVEEEYRARVARPDETRLLQIPESVPVLEITRRTYAIHENTREHRAIETATIVARGDRVVIKSSADIPEKGK